MLKTGSKRHSCLVPRHTGGFELSYVILVGFSLTYWYDDLYQFSKAQAALHSLDKSSWLQHPSLDFICQCFVEEPQMYLCTGDTGLQILFFCDIFGLVRVLLLHRMNQEILAVILSSGKLVHSSKYLKYLPINPLGLLYLFCRVFGDQNRPIQHCLLFEYIVVLGNWSVSSGLPNFGCKVVLELLFNVSESYDVVFVICLLLSSQRQLCL